MTLFLYWAGIIFGFVLIFEGQSGIIDFYTTSVKEITITKPGKGTVIYNN